MTTDPVPCRTRHVNRHSSGPGGTRSRSAGGHHSTGRHRSPEPSQDGDVLDQIRQLRDRGAAYRSIAAAAGLAPATEFTLEELDWVDRHDWANPAGDAYEDLLFERAIAREPEIE
jgi:hypothetical protein